MDGLTIVSHPLVQHKLTLLRDRNSSIQLFRSVVRERLGVSAQEFPLARVLEGGSWAAGRRIAKRLRADGGPPITVISDGTVF